MIIIQDSREQTPLEFKHSYITDVRVEKLDVGDYACEFKDGYRPSIVFERKSIGDLYGTMWGGYKRFKDCIRRSQQSGTTLFIVVEGTLSDVLLGYEHSKVRGTSMLFKLFTLWIRYGIQTIFCEDRREMSEYITQFYIACGKQYVLDKRKEK